MSTGGSFVPAGTPECPYEPYMTHAQAIALRDAGGLLPNCVVVITDGPVIGVPGHTSATQIELNPVGPGDIGRNARVHTNFDNVAFAGLYNIDGAQAGGNIEQLTDGWNNTATDQDSDVATVHTQVCWHLGGNQFRDNTFNDSTLIGVADAVTAGLRFTDNTITNSTVNVTGQASAPPAPDPFFRDNVILESTVRATLGIGYINNNQINNANVTHDGTSAASFSFQNNVLLTGTVTVDAATTSQVTINNNVFGGTSGGYRVAVTGKTAGAFAFAGNRAFGQGNGTAELSLGAGAGAVSVTGCQLNATRIVHNGAGPLTMTNSTWTGGVNASTFAGGSNMSVFGSDVRFCTVTIAATVTGSFNLSVCNVSGWTFNQSGNASGAVSFVSSFFTDGTFNVNNGSTGGCSTSRATILNSTLNHNGSSQMSLSSGWFKAVTVTTAAGSTAGVFLAGGQWNGGTVNQNRSVGTAALNFNDCVVQGSFTVITDNGTTDPGASISLNRLRLVDTVLNLSNLSGISGSGLLQQLDVTGSTLTITATSSILIQGGDIRKSVFTNAGFGIEAFRMLNATKTLTANNTPGRVADPAYDNVI